MASAGGLWPMPYSPTYSTAKAAVVMLVRSLAPSLHKKHRIRLCAVCPQFVDTILGREGQKFQKEVTGMLDVSTVAQAVAGMLQPENDGGAQPGDILALMSQGNALVRRVHLDAIKTVPVYSLPKSFRKIVVQKETHDFRVATEIMEVPMADLKADSDKVLIKTLYCGINASDVNFSAGRYGVLPPMDAGFEGCGVVVRADAQGQFQVGQLLAYMHYGSFSEYVALDPQRCFKVRRACPEVVALLTSGMTASIALEQAARLKPSDIVLITAAAGGTGQFFVQLAKKTGAYVVATCGSGEKATMLKGLGADMVINYKVQDVKLELKQHFPNGVNVVIELVGGEMFDICTKSLATSGRLVVIGAMSQYSSGWKPRPYHGLVERLLAKNQSLVGFFLLNYAKDFKRHFYDLERQFRSGTLKISCYCVAGGIDRVFDAVDLLQGGSSSGKVVVALDAPGRASKL
jgi:NADPH-dependent curcumin reductase CurA